MTSVMKTVARTGIHTAGRSEVYLVADASTLGLAPGEWPETLAVLKKDRWSRDVDLFTKPYPIMHEGRFIGMRYKGADGVVLEVLND